MIAEKNGDRDPKKWSWPDPVILKNDRRKKRIINQQISNRIADFSDFFAKNPETKFAQDFYSLLRSIPFNSSSFEL